MAYTDEVTLDAPFYWLSWATSTVSPTNSGSGSGLTHAAGNTTTSTPGVGGTGYTMVNNGTQYRRYTATPATALNGSNWTVEVWFKKSVAGETAWQEIFNMYKASAGANELVMYASANGDTKPAVWWRDSAGVQTRLYSSVGVNDTNWHHLAAVRNGSTVTLYLDGVSVGSASIGTMAFSGTYDLWFNAYAASSGAENFNGRTDEFAVYSTSLSPTRIARHYYVGAGIAVDDGYTAEIMAADATAPGGTGYGNVQRLAVTDDTYAYPGASNTNYGDWTAVSFTPTQKGFFKSVPRSGSDFEVSRLLHLDGGNATFSSQVINVYRVDADWNEMALTHNNQPPTTFIRSVTVSNTVGDAGKFTVNITNADIGYGVALDSGSGTVVVLSTEDPTPDNRPYVTLTTATQATASFSAGVATAGATMPDATVSATDTVSVGSTPMTATAAMPNATGAGQQFIDLVVEAENMDAYATMGDSGFAVPGGAFAEPLQAAVEITDASVGTTKGVIYNATPMTANGLWRQPATVNGNPIEVNEAEDRYFQRVAAALPSAWLRLNDKGSVAVDRVQPARQYAYMGVHTGQYNGPDNRHSVYFDGNDLIDSNEGGTGVDEANPAGPRALEFSFRTTKANAFLMIGQDSTVEALATNQGAAKEVRLTNGKINFRDYRFGPGFTQSVSRDIHGFRTLNDGEWHHVVIRTPDQGLGTSQTPSGLEIWIDGTFEIRRYETGTFAGFPDYIGGRPNYIEFGSDLPSLSSGDWFEGDMSEIVFYINNNLSSHDIPRNYYAFMGWTPIEAAPVEAFAFTPAGSSGRGNQKRALALTWGLREDFYDRGPLVGNNRPSMDPLLAFSTGVTDYEGYKVFGMHIMNTPYRDAVTDDFRILDLEQDVNIDDFDVIMFQDWPDEGAELDQIEADYPGQKERLVNQLRAANDRGIGLFVTQPALAVDLGIIDRVEWVPTLKESRFSPGQGNATGKYDYGSAYKFPWNIASSSGMVGALGIGSGANGNEASREPGWLAAKAFYYGDTNKNDRFRVRALIDGLTDIPSYMIQDAVFHVDYDPWGWQGAAFKYLHRMGGLQIGDEYIYHGTDFGMSGFDYMEDYAAGRHNGTWATPMVNVKAGTIVTTFGATHWFGNQEVENPYKDYATTIVLEPGDSLRGRAVGGKIFVNFTEQPNRQPDGVVVQVLPDGSNGVTWPQGYDPDTEEQREWEWSFTRTTLNSSQGNTIQTVSITDSLGNIVQIKTPGSDALTMVRSRNVFPLEGYPHYQMVTRGLLWLMERPVEEPGSAIQRVESMDATAAMPSPTVTAQRDGGYAAQPAVALGHMPKVAEDQTGDVEIVTLPLSASATFTGFSRVISAAPMTATAELVENFDAVHTSGEQVVLTLHGVDITLYLKEEA